MGNKLTFKLVIEPKYRGELRFGTHIGLSKWDKARLMRRDEDGDDGGSVDWGTCSDSNEAAGNNVCLLTEKVRLIFSLVLIIAYLKLQMSWSWVSIIENMNCISKLLLWFADSAGDCVGVREIQWFEWCFLN